MRRETECAMLVLSDSAGAYLRCRSALAMRMAHPGHICSAQAYINRTWCHLPPTHANHSLLSCLVDTDLASADYGSAVVLGVDGSANDTVVQGELEALKELGVNVILGCVFDKIGLQMIKGMEVLDWAPYATAMTTTVTTSTYANMIQDENYWQGEYIVGVTPWYQSRNGTGAISGWNSSQFYALYAERYNTGVTEEGAAMFAAAIALVHAIEMADSVDTALVTAQLQAMDLEEFFGTIKFNTDGQGTAKNLVVQYGQGYVRFDLFCVSFDWVVSSTQGGTCVVLSWGC